MILSKKPEAFTMAVFSLSILVICLLIKLGLGLSWHILIFWVILAVITESLGIELPNGAQVSVTLAICMASIMTGGPLLAALVSALGYIFRIIKIGENSYLHLLNTPIYKTIFNASMGTVTAGLAGLAYIIVNRMLARLPLSATATSLIPTIIMVPTYIFINTIILAKMISLIYGRSFLEIWKNSIKDMLPSAVAIGTVGIIIALAYLKYGPLAVLLFFGPLLLARYSFKMYTDMRNVYMETIQALNKTLEAKDSYTSGHAMRVKEYAVKLARTMGLQENRIQNIEKAAILHDIGKIGVDDRILKKPDRLTEDEYRQIKLHPVIGADILKDVDFLKDITLIIRHHHERYDGRGYPDGLKGEEIPLEASILAIADVYDAMTSDRPYRSSMTVEKALDEIRLNSGTQFDPNAAAKFLEVMCSESLKTMGEKIC